MTMEGNTGLSARGSAMFFPSLTLARTYITASSTMTLPDDLAQISSASRMGTPDCSSVPSVRVKRATAIFCSTPPMMGMVSSSRWKNFFPAGWR
jgi:hypothetical protein